MIRRVQVSGRDELYSDRDRTLFLQFKTQYRHSEAYHMSQIRDLPPIAGAIIWAREIERQLSTYMKRVEDVLGKDWVLYAEGQKLQTESASFRRKLETRPLFDAWMQEMNRRDMGINGRLFEIVRLRGGGYQLAVNFDAQTITLFKEVRNLLWLNYQVPHAISNMAKDAKRVYPHAVSLMETVRTYSQTLDLIEKNPAIEILVAEFRNEAQRMISRGTFLAMSRPPIIFGVDGPTRCPICSHGLYCVCDFRHVCSLGLLCECIRYTSIPSRRWARGSRKQKPGLCS
jgi:hypothetical protein